MPPSKNITFEELAKYFHLPINQVAKELGVCATILKKICRRNGIPRWPHRKIKSLDKMISNLEMNLQKNPHEREDINREIDLLRGKKKDIMNNPDILAKGQRAHGGAFPANKLKNIGRPYPQMMKTTETGVHLDESQSSPKIEDQHPTISGGDLKPIPNSQNILHSLGSPSYVDMILTAALSTPMQTTENSKPALAINALLSMADSPKNIPKEVHKQCESSSIPLCPSSFSPQMITSQFPLHIPDFSQSLPPLRILDTSVPNKVHMLPILEPTQAPSIPTTLIPISQITSPFPSTSLPSWFDEERSRITKSFSLG